MKMKVKVLIFALALCTCVGVLTWQMRKTRNSGITVIEIGGKKFTAEYI